MNIFYLIELWSHKYLPYKYVIDNKIDKEFLPFYLVKRMELNQKLLKKFYLILAY